MIILNYKKDCSRVEHHYLFGKLENTSEFPDTIIGAGRIVVIAADCKSAPYSRFVGSNPTLPTNTYQLGYWRPEKVPGTPFMGIWYVGYTALPITICSFVVRLDKAIVITLEFVGSSPARRANKNSKKHIVNKFIKKVEK